MDIWYSALRGLMLGVTSAGIIGTILSIIMAVNV